MELSKITNEHHIGFMFGKDRYAIVTELDDEDINSFQYTYINGKYAQVGISSYKNKVDCLNTHANSSVSRAYIFKSEESLMKWVTGSRFIKKEEIFDDRD